ncbi:Uncharacterised protein [Mycobacteroides abscessus subsp. abscessus]|nr:Uncharacterised protein [Mycobacteroides abscessus subsp. abscessus]
MVGRRDGRHPRGLRRRHEVAEAGRPVEHRVLGVDVEMDEIVVRHGLPSLGCGPVCPPSLDHAGDTAEVISATPDSPSSEPECRVSQPWRIVSRACWRSSGYSLSNSTHSPVSGWWKPSPTAWSHCRCSPRSFASTGSAP